VSWPTGAGSGPGRPYAGLRGGRLRRVGPHEDCVGDGDDLVGGEVGPLGVLEDRLAAGATLFAMEHGLV
jgi:hypothetical protein